VPAVARGCSFSRLGCVIGPISSTAEVSGGHDIPPDEGYAVPHSLIYQRSLVGKDQDLNPPVFESALLR